MATQKGRCNCGSVTISLATPPTPVALCHCLNCRKAGGPYSINYIVNQEDGVITDANNSIKLYQDKDTTSGNICERYFCSTCGSPIYSISVNMPGKRLVKASLFDTISKEKIEVNTENKITWANSD